MQFVWEQRDVEYEYLTSEGPVNVEATNHYEMTFLEMLHYPDLPHPVHIEGALDKASLSWWLSKVRNASTLTNTPYCFNTYQDLTWPCISAKGIPSTGTTVQQAPSGGQRLL